MRDLSEIERVAQAATPGPWELWESEGVCDIRLDPDRVASGSYPPQRRIEWDHGLYPEPYDDEPDPETMQAMEASATARFIAHARTDVPDMAAQIRADDALLLACEWAAEDECGVNMFGEVSFIPVCPVCGQSCKRGHRDGCDLGRRCDEARARQVQ